MNHNTLASKESIEKAIHSLELKGYHVSFFAHKEDSLEKIKELIPQHASVMNGSSQTLEQIGYLSYLKSDAHGWNNLHAQILAENDPQKKSILRKQSVLSDYYLGSVHALMENGEFIVASNTGSQLPHIVFTSQNLIFVVSTKKIVKDFNSAMERLTEYVVPLEDKRSRKEYGVDTALNKMVIFKNENPTSGRKIYILLVAQDLGF